MGEQNANTILVTVNDAAITRGRAPKPMEIGVLAENVNLFLTQINGVLEKTPDTVGRLRLTEITVTAEISAKGALILMGTGIETTGTGGITFKFQKLPQ